MKRRLPFTLAVCALALAGFLYSRYVTLSPAAEWRLPAGPEEENRSVRVEWERRMLADPHTGRIPEGIRFQERWWAKDLFQAATVAQRSEAQWQIRGPWNYGGRTRALTLDVNNENRMLAGGVSGGVWLSEDAGQSWSRRTPLDAHPGCVSIAQDVRPGKTDTWYYLSGEIYGTSASGGDAFYLGDGLFKSTDKGLSWTAVASTAGGNPQSFNTFFQTGWRVITDPVDAAQDVLYMATMGTIYRSINGGGTWTAVRGGSTSAYSYFTDVAITPTGVLYATLSSEGPQAGIWRSTNGTTWTRITPANFPATYNRIVIGINPNNTNEVFFLGETPGSGHYNNYIDSDDWSSLWKYTYLSGDGSGTGGQWENRSANLPSTGTEFDQFACQGGYDLVVKVQPGSNTVFVGGTGLWRSTDGFATANSTAHLGGYKPGTTLPFFEIYPNHHPDVHDVLFLPSNPKVLLSASDGGLHRTEDCLAPNVVWSSLNRGYHTTQFYTAIIDKKAPNDPMIIGGLQDNGNFHTASANPLDPWRQTVNGDGAYGGVAPGKAYYVLSIQQGKVAKVDLAADGTVKAFRRIDPIGPKKSDYQFINPLALDPNDANVLYLPAGNRLYRQNALADIALTGIWDSISQGWTRFPDSLPPVTGGHTFTAIAVSEKNPTHRVYLGTDRNQLYRIDDAHTGTPSMKKIASPFAGVTGYVSSIAIDPDNADHVVMCYSNYNVYSVYRTLNGGTSWQKVAGNLEASANGGGPLSVRSVAILPFPDGSRKYFCGTSIGLFSADSLTLHSNTLPGTKWMLEAPGQIGSAVVSYLETRAIDGLVVAATHGNGLFTANFKPASATQAPATSVQVRLWPNPATDFIQLDMPQEYASGVRWSLYDARGIQVQQRLLQSPLERIPVQHMRPGVYYYTLQGKGWSKSGKVVVAE